MSTKNATLQIETETISLPIKEPSLGQHTIDIQTLAQKGVFTFDPGFTSTASCESKITYIDGEKGILLYRGYPIEELSQKSSYLETTYLLLNGELPSTDHLAQFEQTIRSSRKLPAQLEETLKHSPKNIPPMSLLLILISTLAGIEHNSLQTDSESRLKLSQQLIAIFPTMIAYIYRHINNLPFIEPNPEHSYSEAFLHMMFDGTDNASKISPELIDAFDKILILHADHEQNASTSTVRLAASTGTNPFTAIASGVSALWGAAHGGANEAVLNMLTDIGSTDQIPHFIERSKDKSDPFRLMGFGHRVYKNYDPRAKVIQKACNEVLDILNIQTSLLSVAKELENIALNDPYFIEKKLYPNVDFYSGILLKAIGIPTDFFTTIFALGRVSGWISHWHEMMSETLKIGRPRQLYTGYTQRSYEK